MEASTKTTYHELIKPYLANLLAYLRKVLAEENAPEEVSVLYIAQFTALFENSKKFEEFVENLMTMFWKKKSRNWKSTEDVPDPEACVGWTPADLYELDFDAMEEQKKNSTELLDNAHYIGQITDEELRDAKLMLQYEMTAEHKQRFRRYLTMFCEVRHNSNALK